MGSTPTFPTILHTERRSLPKDVGTTSFIKARLREGGPRKYLYVFLVICHGGGTGIHAGLRNQCPCGLRVRIPPVAPNLWQ